MRTEFGVPRSECGCHDCRANCEHMPGFLIPADLARMVPPGVDIFQWAEDNLLASPGAILKRGDDVFRLHTLVPATKPDSSCIHLYPAGCAIHAIAPFGCAFFGCTAPVQNEMARKGFITMMQEGPESLYVRLWEHLHARGKRQLGPEVLTKRVAAARALRRSA